MCEMTLNERASYIKGLCDGMELDTTTKEGKVIAALLDLCNDLGMDFGKYFGDYRPPVKEDVFKGNY